jgi:hypothetical protein
MHGGASGSGAPLGNQNALKGGTYTQFARDQRRKLKMMLNVAERLLATEIEGGWPECGSKDDL